MFTRGGARFHAGPITTREEFEQETMRFWALYEHTCYGFPLRRVGFPLEQSFHRVWDALELVAGVSVSFWTVGENAIHGRRGGFPRFLDDVTEALIKKDF